LIGSNFSDQAGSCQAAGARKLRLFGYGAEKLVCGGEWRAVNTLGSGEIEIGFVDGNHFDDG
jgi:hypothetical protein